jgi:16S rRNA (cytosine1402-N4)-methyltransferase
MEQHIPVLLEQVIDVLAPKPGEIFIDLTAGFGGHSAALLERVGKSGEGVLIDQDPEAVAALNDRFKNDPRVHVKKANFGDLAGLELPFADMILADIGVSSVQLDRPERGFSFKSDGPLDMRMDTSQGETAAELIARLPEARLADVIYEYGEERRSRRIAKAIVETRKVSTIDSTAQLAQIVEQAVGHDRKSKIHPATKTFQALRIAVNDELGALTRMLPTATALLKPGGRLAVISFHSLEDRMVKQYFRTITRSEKDQMGQDVSVPKFRLVTKKPIAGLDEKDFNPRARSAKLRAVEYIK